MNRDDDDAMKFLPFIASVDSTVIIERIRGEF